MITLFSTCKPFRGVYEHIQYNALSSWALLKPQPRVILFGDDAGTAEAARFFNFEHIPNVQSRSFKERDIDGPQRRATKPSIADMFRVTEKEASGDMLVYVNADILLTNLTSEMLRVRQQLSQFLLVGQRYNVHVNRRINFDKNWIDTLRKVGKLHPVCGIDYLAFTCGLWEGLPDFTVGYIGFDNYLVSTALARGKPVVDGTRTILVFHQEHPLRQRKDAGDMRNINLWGTNPWESNGYTSNATWTLNEWGVWQK